MTAAAFCLVLFAQAQNFIHYNFCENSLSDYNAASIMEDGSLAYGRVRYNWYANAMDLYQENPLDLTVGGNAVFDWGGITAKIGYDEYSYFKCHSLQINYAYQWKTGKNGHNHFSVGGGLSMGIYDIDMNKLRYDEGKLMGCTPDFNLGFEYSNGKLRTGVGMVNLLATGVKVDGARITRNPRVILTYFLYRFDIKDIVGITPMAYVGYSEKAHVEIDLRFDYRKIVSLSYGFRAMELVHIVNFSLNIPKTPITLDCCIAGAQFYKSQALTGGVTVHF